MNKVRVIFHIDEFAKWPLLLANLRNLVNVADITQSEIEVLANSEAARGCLEAGEYSAEVSRLSGSGVMFKVCQNSLNGQNISLVELNTNVKVVSVGVLDLIERQADGLAYIKP
ncbi:DsrE family protein [Vibrio sp.]|nr:DsrE family protein [Vibrio sp.]